MARTPSTMLALGTRAPEFALPDLDGRIVTLAGYAHANERAFVDARAYLVMFICNHCPYVKHVADHLARLGVEYQAKGVAMFAINSNDAIAYPDDSPEAMRREARERGYTFPYLYDESQDVAKAYRAACTPDFYLFDAERRLVYRGQLDGSRPKNEVPVTGADLRHALDAVLAGTTPSAEQFPSLGCNIKWRESPGY
ncbi:MAG: thioredoxin family protein [Gemmatimonadaceae bacterium]|nr:thioredoxin family protein [Gemmatimonadaceae bacterium]